MIGLDKVPDKMLTPSELLELVHAQGAAAIAAHPYRKNNRGLEDNIFTHKMGSNLPLTAVEVCNGSTPEYLNAQAGETAHLSNLATTAGSDAHFKERVGLMATYFPYEINTEEELIAALKKKDCRPMYYENGEYHFFDWTTAERRVNIEKVV